MAVDQDLDMFVESQKDQKPPELSEEAFKKEMRKKLLLCADRNLISRFKEKHQEKRRGTTY
jgi:hypothetical protein